MFSAAKRVCCTEAKTGVAVAIATELRVFKVLRPEVRRYALVLRLLAAGLFEEEYFGS